MGKALKQRPRMTQKKIAESDNGLKVRQESRPATRPPKTSSARSWRWPLSSRLNVSAKKGAPIIVGI